MTSQRVPDRGDVYWVLLGPEAGGERKGRHLFLVMSPAAINKYGVAIMVAITGGGVGPREIGLTVPIKGHNTHGVVVCTQLRSLAFRAPERQFEYFETLDDGTVKLVAEKIASILDPR